MHFLFLKLFLLFSLSLFFNFANSTNKNSESFSLKEIKEALQKIEPSKRGVHLQQFLKNLKEAKAQVPTEQSDRLFLLSQSQMLLEPIVELTTKTRSPETCEEAHTQIESIIGNDRGPEDQWPDHATHAFSLLTLFCE